MISLFERFLNDFCEPAGVTSSGQLEYVLKEPRETIERGGKWGEIHEHLYVVIGIGSHFLRIEVWHKGSDDEPECKEILDLNGDFPALTAKIAALVIKASVPYIEKDKAEFEAALTQAKSM
jgi:hypothetical protein